MNNDTLKIFAGQLEEIKETGTYKDERIWSDRLSLWGTKLFVSRCGVTVVCSFTSVFPTSDLAAQQINEERQTKVVYKVRW